MNTRVRPQKRGSFLAAVFVLFGTLMVIGWHGSQDVTEEETACGSVVRPAFEADAPRSCEDAFSERRRNMVWIGVAGTVLAVVAGIFVTDPPSGSDAYSRGNPGGA